MIKYKRTAILAAAVAAFSAPALAAPTLNFSIQTSQFNKPTMEFKYQGGKYVWESQAINAQFSASANTNDNKLLWGGPLKIQTLGVGGSAYFTGIVPDDVKSWSLSGPIVFPTHFLSVYQAGFASYCEQNGVVGKPVVNQGLSILFSASQAYTEKLGVGEVPEEVQPGEPVGASTVKRASRTVNMPMTVSCGPKPASTQPRPGGLVQEKGKLRVTSIEHRYMTVVGDVTKPNPATQCKRTRLSVTLKANQAGPVRFRLNKKIGNGPTQAKALDLWASHQNSGPFKGLFVANHQEWITVEKSTAVQTMAEELVNPIGLTTQWKEIVLHCTGAGGGGLAGTPNTSNPDNQKPQAPKQPKRVFDGPGNLSPGKPKPTHSTVKPVIVPATPKKPVQIKTAPVAPTYVPKRLAPLKGDTQSSLR